MASFKTDSSGFVLSLQASSEELRQVDEKLVRSCFDGKFSDQELGSLSDSELAELANQALGALATPRA